MLRPVESDRVQREDIVKRPVGYRVSEQVKTQQKESMPRQAARASLNRLLSWLDAAPEVTADPFDFKAHPWFVRKLSARNQLSSKLALKAAYTSFALAPNLMRRFLKVKKIQTAGAAAWLSQGHIELFRLTKDETDRAAALSWLEQLNQLRADTQEVAWGLPFDWQSLVLLPANCPLLYPTWQSGQAFYNFYRITGDSASLKLCLAACLGMGSVFNRLVDTPTHLCLSYSPHDQMQVYNINALAGGICCQVGAATYDSTVSDLGFRMLNWVTDGQQQDGSWEYFSNRAEDSPSFIDHFHTAMTLQGLLDGLEVVAEQKWRCAVEAGLQFYLSRMFDAKDRPKYFDVKTFPIDIMSSAEGILLLSKVQKSPFSWISHALRQESLERLEALVLWSCSNLQAPQGHFYYRVYPVGKLSLCSHRWGQGAMLKALASYLNTI
jgi:hypothetical protein